MAYKQEELLLSVADITLIDNETKVEYATASLKTHNVSQTVDTSEIRAGRKNAIVATLETNKTVTVEIEDVHANRDWLAIAADTHLQEKTSVDIRVLPQKVKVGESLKIKLSKQPKVEGDVKVYKDGVELDVEFDGSDKTLITLSLPLDGAEGTELNVGDVVQVMSYIYTAKAADVMALGGESAGRSYSMYMEESVFNNDMKVIATKTTYFPRVVPESNFTLAGSSELAEQNMSYKFTATQAEGEEALGYIYYVDAE